MPKLDLVAATRIKVAGGEVARLKGPGFAWEKPAIGVGIDATWLGHHEVNAQGQTTRTASGVSLGAAASDREIIVIFAGRMSAVPTFGTWTVTVGSDVLTQVAQYAPGGAQALALVYRGTVPAGTSANVSLQRASGTATISGGMFGMVRVTGSPVLNSPLLGNTTALPGDGSRVFNLSLNVAEGDALIVAGAATNKLTGSGFIFAGATERFDGGFTNGGGAMAFEANLPAGAPRTVTVNVTGENSGADGLAGAWRLRA